MVFGWGRVDAGGGGGLVVCLVGGVVVALAVGFSFFGGPEFDGRDGFGGGLIHGAIAGEWVMAMERRVVLMKEVRLEVCDGCFAMGADRADIDKVGVGRDITLLLRRTMKTLGSEGYSLSRGVKADGLHSADLVKPCRMKYMCVCLINVRTL